MPRPKKAEAKIDAESWRGVGEPEGSPACHNCASFFERLGEVHGVCGVDLPPFLKRYENKSQQLVNQNYLCRLYKSRKEA